MYKLALIIILLIVLFLFVFKNKQVNTGIVPPQIEHFTMVDNFGGVYSLMPVFNEKYANPAITLQINPQSKISPSYLDFIVTYQTGADKMVRTNLNVGSIYSYYNDITNVEFLDNPKNTWYELDTSDGTFKALTVVKEYTEAMKKAKLPPKERLKLLTYKIVRKIRST